MAWWSPPNRCFCNCVSSSQSRKNSNVKVWMSQPAHFESLTCFQSFTEEFPFRYFLYLEINYLGWTQVTNWWLLLYLLELYVGNDNCPEVGTSSQLVKPCAETIVTIHADILTRSIWLTSLSPYFCSLLSLWSGHAKVTEQGALLVPTILKPGINP